MPWTTPETFTAGQTLTAASMNALNANIKALNGERTATAIRPMCVLTGTTQVIPNTTATTLTYSTEAVDTDTMHSTSSNTDRITVNTAGVYIVTADLEVAGSGADGSRVLLLLQKNGTEVGRFDSGNYSASSALGFSLAVTTSCVATDYLTFAVFQSSGGNRTVNRSHFAATWQGPTS